MNGELIYHALFYFLGAVALGSASIVALSQNIGRAIFMLLFTLGAVAGYYAWLGAGFLAIVQLLVYVGGILVILMFALMISEKFPVDPDASPPGKLIASSTAAIIFLLAVFSAYFSFEQSSKLTVDSFPKVEQLGELLLTTYLLPFELAGVVLLVALMAATLLTRNPAKYLEERSE